MPGSTGLARPPRSPRRESARRDPAAAGRDGRQPRPRQHRQRPQEPGPIQPEGRSSYTFSESNGPVREAPRANETSTPISAAKTSRTDSSSTVSTPGLTGAARLTHRDAPMSRQTIRRRLALCGGHGPHWHVTLRLKRPPHLGHRRTPAPVRYQARPAASKRPYRDDIPHSPRANGPHAARDRPHPSPTTRGDAFA
jgi:hypothetical protein